MIPIKLQLRNFMCYREGSEPLDFEQFRIACLSGDNGNGKSALLDAVTWALWGRSRAKTEDELIYVGATEMEVEFEFRLGEEVFRVIRKRSRRRGGSAPALELQVKSGQGWRPLTGNSLRDTERRIVDLLKLDYETFVNSSFLLQGRADSFTTQAPNDRKRILAEILGLQQYDRLEERARDFGRERKGWVEKFNGEIARIDTELAKKPGYERDLETYQSEVSDAEGIVAGIETELGALLVRQADLDRQRALIPDLERRSAEDRKRLGEVRRRLEDLLTRRSDLKKILDDREAIEAGRAALVEARSIVELHADRATKLSELNALRESSVRRIEGERGRLEGERRSIESRLGKLAELTSKAEQHRQELIDAERVQQVLGAEQEQLERQKLTLAVLVDRAGEMRGSMAALRAEMEELKRAIIDLQGTGPCPVCGHELTASERSRLLREHEAEGTRRGDSYRDLRSKLQETESERDTLKADIERRETDLKRQVEQQILKAGKLRRLIEIADQAVVEARQLQPRLDEIAATLLSGEFAQADRESLMEVDQTIKGLGFDRDEYERGRSAVKQFLKYDELYVKLGSAADGLPVLAGNIADAESDIRELEGQIAERERELRSLSAVVEDYRVILASIQALRAKSGEAAAVRREAENRRSRAEQLIDTCNYYERERMSQVHSRDEAAREQNVYEELAAAFGKRGVQAMIIEGVLGEIEGAANEILGRMSDGRMSVAFETQRDRAGSKGAAIETLDIRIADELGTRSYELYSGGEAFRINFAIRVALAKLLARRAGARLETLVIDEGFGTQDASGRDRLVEAIRAVEEDFAKIVVVTHIEELKEAFPVRIDVSKSADGSTFVVRHR